MADLVSNLYVITSGKIPTVETLPENCMAFGNIDFFGDGRSYACCVLNVNNEITTCGIGEDLLSRVLNEIFMNLSTGGFHVTGTRDPFSYYYHDSTITERRFLVRKSGTVECTNVYLNPLEKDEEGYGVILGLRNLTPNSPASSATNKQYVDTQIETLQNQIAALSDRITELEQKLNT